MSSWCGMEHTQAHLKVLAELNKHVSRFAFPEKHLERYRFVNFSEI
jgi:hypothetical protein